MRLLETKFGTDFSFNFCPDKLHFGHFVRNYKGSKTSLLGIVNFVFIDS